MISVSHLVKTEIWHRTMADTRRQIVEVYKPVEVQLWTKLTQQIWDQIWRPIRECFY